MVLMGPKGYHDAHSQHPLMHTLLMDAAHYVSTCPAHSEASRALVQDLIEKHLQDTTCERS